jgi:hypothetical protein
MPHDFQGHRFMLWPLAIAGLMAVFVPPWTDIESGSASTTMRRAVYAECQAQALAPDTTAPRSGTTPRTQSPAWLQQRQAELFHCLQASLPGQVLSASR